MSSLFLKQDNICNICRKEFDSLSEDHVPPKGTLVNKKFWINNFGRIFTKHEERDNLKFSQSGIRFKTICRNCNSDLSEYDKKLIEFTKNIQLSLFELKDKKLNKIIVNLYPVAVMRSLLAHILAAKTETDNIVPDQKVRSFLLDKSKPIDKDLHIFYWLYPYSDIRICRDFTMSSIRGRIGDFIFCSTIKFFPIGFLISDKATYEGLPNLDLYRDKKSDFYCNIEIPIFPLKPVDWPESVTDDNPFIAGGRSFMDSFIAESK
jgi:hypothetical protein